MFQEKRCQSEEIGMKSTNDGLKQFVELCKLASLKKTNNLTGFTTKSLLNLTGRFVAVKQTEKEG